MRLKVLAIVALLVVASSAIAVSLGLFRPATSQASTLLTAAASTTDVTDEVTASGTVQPKEAYDVAFGSPPATVAASSSASSSSSSSSNASNGSSSSGSATVSWPVTKVDVKVGDRVTKGQELAVAGRADLLAQIADASRSSKAANLQVTEAQAQVDGAPTTTALRQARVGLYNAQSSAAKASSNLAALVAEGGYSTLRAPADGIVTSVAVTAGQDAPSGTAVAIASATLEVTTNVVETDIASIQTGQTATVTVSAINATLQGTVSAIDPSGTSSGNNGVVQFPITITLDAPPPALRSGMSADVSIVTASATGVLAVPSRALSGTAGSYSVRVIGADGSTSVRPVEVGIVTSSLAEIKSGLQAGERVVTGTSSSQTTVTNGGGFGGLGGGAGGVIRNGGDGGGVTGGGAHP